VSSRDEANAERDVALLRTPMLLSAHTLLPLLRIAAVGTIACVSEVNDKASKNKQTYASDAGTDSIIHAVGSVKNTCAEIGIGKLEVDVDRVKPQAQQNDQQRVNQLPQEHLAISFGVEVPVANVSATRKTKSERNEDDLLRIMA